PNENNFTSSRGFIMTIKKGIKVKVLAGKDKKKEGEVIEIDRKSNRAKIKGINIIKKHVKTTKEKKGGIVEKENFMNISNLAVIDSKKKEKKDEVKK
ncbi:uncharacterized protein METZ01_LOCUS315465, partial [marine metagenome]